MPKSATDVMQEVIFSAALDTILALKSASKGVPNALLRDLNAIHANTTFSDVPKEMQVAIAASVRAAFTRLLKEGYSISAGQADPPRNPSPQRGQAFRERSTAAKGGRTDARRPPSNGGRPKRTTKPKPRSP